MVGTRGSPEPVRVLVVDDDPVARRLLAAAMNSSVSHEILVRETADAHEAEALLRGTAFAGATVSLDLATASDTITTLRRAGLSGPIVATSSRGSVSSAVEAMRAGADDFLVKPYQPAELARRLLDAARRARAEHRPGSWCEYRATGIPSFHRRVVRHACALRADPSASRRRRRRCSSPVKAGRARKYAQKQSMPARRARAVRSSRSIAARSRVS